MAVTTTYKRQEETARNTQPMKSSMPYNGMNGVSQNTANNLGNYQQGYQQGQQVSQAQQNLQKIQAQKPQGYNSKYQGALDNIMAQIQNPKEFKYEFNGDNLFKNYADLYTQKAKQASMDTMGMAAGLTGGYGNSYAQNVATQAYQQNLLPLYDKGMELSQQAYQRYQDQLGNQKDIYNMLQGADESAYGRYRDTVGDWQNEEQQAYNRMMDADEMDYARYRDALDYWNGLAQVENAAYNTEAERQEAIRQYDQDFAEAQRINNRNYDRSVLESDRDYDYNAMRDARDYERAVLENDRDFAEAQRLNNRNYDRDVLESDRDFAENQRLNDRNYNEDVRRYNTDNQYRYDTLNWQKETDARDYNESVRQNEQNYAYKYVTAILANGQMPSRDLLAAAGLSEADARLLMAQMQASGGAVQQPTTVEDPQKYVQLDGKYYNVAGDNGQITTKNVQSTVPKNSIVTNLGTDNRTTANTTGNKNTNASNGKTSGTGNSISTASANKATNTLLQKAKKLMGG